MSKPSNNQYHPYQTLTPDTILDAIEASGFECNGRLLALNSYENRVYQVGLVDGSFIIVKFYRPARWSDAAIEEEHAFALELAAHEVPVVAPLADCHGATLLHHAGFRFALFPRRGGHWPELEQPDTLLRLGRFLGRLHAVGASRSFEHRPALDIDSFGVQPRNFLIEHNFLPQEYIQQYSDLTESILEKVANGFERAANYPLIRLHGDFHPGNILWTEGGAHLVDLDDCRMGPAIQDLWMLLSGERSQMNAQLSELVAGYEEFFDFEPRQLHLIEPLRSLRLIHYAAWLARRWEDPAFPMAFPWFNTPRYWEEQILTLREQLNRLDAPVLNY
jgi:Ser/Thr protein kinase RdoA (MazF antagonist)